MSFALAAIFKRWKRGIRDPEPGSARIKLLACRVCHGDLFITEGSCAEFMLTPPYTLARIPTELTPEEAAPIMCAGSDYFQRAAQQRRVSRLDK